MTTLDTSVQDFVTSQMWDGFSGATGWNERRTKSTPETAPLCRSLADDAFVIADSECVQLYLGEDADDVWSMDIQFPTQDAARLFLASLPTSTDEVIKLGFESIM